MTKRSGITTICQRPGCGKTLELDEHGDYWYDQGTGNSSCILSDDGQRYLRHIIEFDAEAELAGLAAELDGVKATSRELLAEAPASESTAVVPVGSDAEVVKTKMASARADLVRAQEQAESLHQRMRAVIQVQKRDLERRQRAMELEMAPLKEKLELMTEGIETINLYLGRDESFEVLVEGEPMPADEPLAVRQMTLYMDEEVAAVDEDDGEGIHAGRIEWFDNWIKDPAHLRQVLPEPKGIVALEPRRHIRRDPDQASRKDHQTYWLIRNGTSVYRMLTDATTFGPNSGFRAGERIVPEREEFTSYFQVERYRYDNGQRVTWTEPMQPGTEEWLKAEKQAGARQRHFMKIALVLQGLVDRTTVFHPLPAAGLSFLGPESYDSGAIRIVTDAELSLGTGLEPFFDWLVRLNSGLRVGMRVVGNFSGHNLEPYDYRYSHRDGYARLSPTNASLPVENEIHTLDERVGPGQFRFKYQRTDKREGYKFPSRPSWDQGPWGQWPYKQRASCRIDVTDKFVIPFDLVTVEELERYLAARTERHAYADMFPAIKECIAAKIAEREAEAPVRAMLAGHISSKTGDSVADIEELLPELVDWWKLKNRWHRPLVSEDAAEVAKATRMILAEYKDRKAAEGNRDEEEAQVSKLRAAYPSALLIGRRKDGTYTTFVPEHPEMPWVAEYKTSKTGRSTTEVKRWGLVGNGWRSWRVLYAAPEWEKWDLDATDRVLLRPHEVEQVTAEIVDYYTGFGYSRFRDGSEREDLQVHSVFLQERGRGKEHKVVFRVEMYELPIAAEVPELLLSESIKRPEEHYAEVSWERRGNGQVKVLFEEWNYHSLHRSSRDSDQGEPLWNDPVIQAEFEAALAVAREAEEIGAGLAAKVKAGFGSIVKQWNDFAYAATYARFLEDFKDPDLWEGHLKHTKIPTWPHPDSTRYGGHYSMPGQPKALIRSLVERGVEVHGLTVQEAIDLHRSVVGTWEEPGEWVPTGHGSAMHSREGTHTVDYTVGVPDDVLAMTILTEPSTS